MGHWPGLLPLNPAAAASDKSARRPLRHRMHLTKKLRKVPVEIQATIVAHILAGNTIATSALCAGIARDTLYDWMNRGKAGKKGFAEFFQAVEIARAQAEAILVNTVRAAANAGKEARGAQWMLERRFRKDWGVHETREIVTTVTAKDLASMSDAELEALDKQTAAPDGG